MPDYTLLSAEELEQLLNRPGWKVADVSDDKRLAAIAASPDFECAVSGVTLHATDNHGTMWTGDIGVVMQYNDWSLDIRFIRIGTLRLRNELLGGPEQVRADGHPDRTGFLSKDRCYAV